MINNFSQRASNLINDMVIHIYPCLLKNSTFKEDINYTPCELKLLDDDNSTIWVKWGPYNCKFTQLPLDAMVTIADNIAYN